MGESERNKGLKEWREKEHKGNVAAARDLYSWIVDRPLLRSGVSIPRWTLDPYNNVGVDPFQTSPVSSVHRVKRVYGVSQRQRKPEILFHPRRGPVLSLYFAVPFAVGPRTLPVISRLWVAVLYRRGHVFLVNFKVSSATSAAREQDGRLTVSTAL